MKREPIPFQPLLQHAPVECYFNGLLPHWRQHGATYFVTFRTADSLPAVALQELKEEQNAWLRAHGIDASNPNWKDSLRKGPEKTIQEFRREFDSRVNEYLDRGAGACPLRNSSVAGILQDCLHFFEGSRLRLGDFVIMPNHVHALIKPLDDHRLEDLLGSIKGTSARKINQLLGTKGAFWQRDSYDHIVRNFESLARFQKYIRDNPATAGIDPTCVISREATCAV